MDLNKATRLFHRSVLTIRKASPTILVVGGVVGLGATAVVAVIRSKKAAPVTQELKAELKSIEYMPEDSTPRDRAVFIGQAYGTALGGYIKAYWPALILGASSAAAVFGGHGMTLKRNAALTATLVASERAFRLYRDRAAADNGEAVADSEKEPRIDTSEETPTDTAEMPSQYARFFDELSPSWTKDGEHNLTFLKCQQNYANDKLRARGHVFLNEVYDSLGIPRTRAGAIVGWIYGGSGDDVIDFGVFDVRNGDKRAFVNGKEKAILLDFNVDGVIYDLI